MKKVRKKTGLFISCPCGSKAAVVETNWGYNAHCTHCGKLIFWRNAQLTEKVELGGALCSHKPELKDCKGGKTSWCSLCRVRTFLPLAE